MVGENTKIRRWPCLVALLLPMAALLIHSESHAAPCTESGSRAPIDIVVPTINVARDTPVGAVLLEVTSPYGSYVVDCSTANNIRTTSLARPLRGNGIMDVIDQNGDPIPGLGMRLTPENDFASADGNPSSYCTGARYPLQPRMRLTCRQYISYGTGDVWREGGGSFGIGPLKLTFVKTSTALESAVLGADTVLTTRMDNYSPISFRITGGRVVSNPCTFTVPSTVQLGNVASSTLQNNQGSNPVPFQLGVNCSSSAKVKIRFSPAGGSRAAAAAGTLTNSNTSATAASGVGVQLTDASGNPVRLDSDIDYGTQGPVAQFNFNARMVPIGESIRAGQVNAGAVVNFTFN